MSTVPRVEVHESADTLATGTVRSKGRPTATITTHSNAARPERATNSAIALSRAICPRVSGVANNHAAVNTTTS